MSETYTAVYEREGQTWTAEIAGLTGVQACADSLPKVRDLIRQALGVRLDTDPAGLSVTDQIGLPRKFKATQERVRAERSEQEVARLMDKMAGPISAKDWAEDMRLAGRQHGAVRWLESLDPGVQFTPDQLCHRITVAEEIGRWGECENEAAGNQVMNRQSAVSEDPARAAGEVGSNVAK